MSKHLRLKDFLGGGDFSLCLVIFKTFIFLFLRVYRFCKIKISSDPPSHASVTRGAESRIVFLSAQDLTGKARGLEAPAGA